ncbi:MAG: hypothetical protein KDD34_02025 [Bdellovibrionales bacterium]|nr:hypothetical protein [Bdellovibrionales bacterium]
MRAIEMAQHIANELENLGVREICLCSGARNAPLVEAFQKNENFRIMSFFDERSAAFFALGRARKTQTPVVVCTTSGTAASELLSATIEAYYSEIPLILLTADRPPRFRYSGAPQSMDQLSFFKNYTQAQWELESEFLSLSKSTGPIHINVCLEDPVGPKQSNAITEKILWEDVQKPLVIIGELNKEEKKWTRDFLRENQCVFIAEAHSCINKTHENEFKSIEVSSQVVSKSDFPFVFDGILRLGRVPTLRLWRDLEESLDFIPVKSFSHHPWSGLGREDSSPESFEVLKDLKINYEIPKEISIRQNSFLKKREGLVAEFPKSELALIQTLSKVIHDEACVFLGNSLPIREWDLVADSREDIEVISQRGMNGIDGLISTFMAMANEKKENVIVVGDLSAFYDVNAFWNLRYLNKNLSLRIVIINNQGGRIFRRLFKDPILQTTHEEDFQSFSKLWQLPYITVSSTKEMHDQWKLLPQQVIVEVQPDLAQSDRAWEWINV